MTGCKPRINPVLEWQRAEWYLHTISLEKGCHSISKQERNITTGFQCNYQKTNAAILLWPSDALWWQKSGSTLIQLMAYCMMASSHKLNHCWLIVKYSLWHWLESHFTKKLISSIRVFRDCNFMTIVPRSQWVDSMNRATYLAIVTQFIIPKHNTLFPFSTKNNGITKNK